MAEKRTRILILVEGAKTDLRLMRKLLRLYGIEKNHEIISYNTNIYTLYNKMFKYFEPEEVDLLQLLKENEPDQEKRKIFDIRYSDILLVFDLDPQDPQFSAEKIIEMQKYFKESSDMGKLYINYPMVEAFYHMKSIPDEAFNSYFVSLEELRNKTYKQRVQKESFNHDYTKFAVTKEECSVVIRQNLEKAHKLIAPFQECNFDTLLLKHGEILEKQLELLELEEKVSVICTCGFYIVDYNSSLIANVPNS